MHYIIFMYEYRSMLTFKEDMQYVCYIMYLKGIERTQIQEWVKHTDISQDLLQTMTGKNSDVGSKQERWGKG